MYNNPYLQNPYGNPYQNPAANPYGNQTYNSIPSTNVPQQTAYGSFGNRPGYGSVYNPQPVQPVTSQNPPADQVNGPIGLTGRIVQREEEITPSEVRMDGSIGVFPSADLSGIYVKYWDQNADFHTVRYVPEVAHGSQDAEAATDASIMPMLVQMSDQIQNLKDIIENLNAVKAQPIKTNRTNQNGSKTRQGEQ